LVFKRIRGGIEVVKKGAKGDRAKEFLVEAEDILNSMGKDLLKLGRGVKAGIIDPAVLNSIFRSAHTMKGMSGLCDCTDMSVLSHALEDTLDLLRLDRIILSTDLLDGIMKTHELLVRIISAKCKEGFGAEVEELKTRLLEYSRTGKVQGKDEIDKELLSVLTEYEAHRLKVNLQDGKYIFIVGVKFPVASFDKGYASLIVLLKNEAEIIATLPSAKTAREMLFFDILISTVKPKSFISSVLSEVGEVELKTLAEPSDRPQADRGEGEPKTVRRGRAYKPNGETLRRASNTVRVKIEKLDYLMNIVSELGIIKSSVESLGAELKNEDGLSFYGIKLSRIGKHLERKFSELRDGVLDVRMIPVGQLFNRFDTFVDRLSRESGKEVRIVSNGDDTELDKIIAEEIADPLMHIIRNIVDHAIEEPKVREERGKRVVGTITLSAFQKGNHVVIEVRDDGAGMDEELIKKKAVEKGLVAEKDLAGLSTQEVLEFVFMPGFTTRDVVGATSGRGVGMDVVKENITRLSGVVDIETVKGKGTRFVLTIPSTLAIIQALIVEDGSVKYAIPLNSVVEIVELHGGFVPEEPDGTVTLNDREVSYVKLADFFGRPAASGSNGEVGYGIVAGLADQRLCIAVDRLLEELDVVIKPLPEILKVPGIAGATDMGEKGTLLVLDVPGILEQRLKERKPPVKQETVV
jgi:two-component system chemotaxis sensor kinase CheA